VSGAAATVEGILRERFAPIHLELHDESDRHAGHPGATSGGGHFRVVIVSEAFEGLSRLEQHRLVNDALRDLFGPVIHALGLTTCSPAEWERRRGS
jgi:BolA protein